MDRRLIDSLPPVLQPVREYMVILDTAEQAEIESFWNALESLWAEQFIDSASVVGLSRWEDMMRLPPNGSLEERREAILARLRELPPFTFFSLLDALDAMCGILKYEAALIYHSYTLRIRITPRSPMAGVRAMLTRMVPANILIDLDYLYLKHSQVAMKRHQELAAYTHKVIREMTD